jgi:large subunit ribosomal protein L4
MKHAIHTLDGAESGSLDLSDLIYGLEPRTDILYRCVRWQLAKRQQGTHQTQGRATIARTTRKIYKQKGTGSARHGSAKAPQFRGGGRSFGPVSRSHEHDLPKRVRVLALKLALSSKVKDNQLLIIDQAETSSPKTKDLLARFTKLSLSNALIISGGEVQNNFALAARSIPNIDVLPVQGINVYDILRREKLVLTKAAVEALQERFK